MYEQNKSFSEDSKLIVQSKLSLRPAQVTATFVEPRLNCDLNFVMKSYRKCDLSRKRLLPLLGLPNWLDSFFVCKL